MATSNNARTVSTPIPWLSGLLLAACVVVSIQARLQQDGVAREGLAALDAAREYFLAHPYLEPGPLLATRLDAALIQRTRTEYDKGRTIEIPPGVKRRQQVELDEQISAALANVRALPARAYAVVSADGVAPTWILYALLHLGNLHLLGNGLLLLLFGVYLERSFGRIAYAGAVATATLAGAAAWTAMAPDESRYGLVGSTPLLAGLLTAFAIRFARHRGESFYWAGCVFGAVWIVLPPFATAAWSFTGIELIATAAPPVPTLVYWPCLAAAGGGALASAVAWLLGADGEQDVDASPAARDPRYRRAMRARRAGRPREALEMLSDYLAAEPDAYEAALALWEVACELGRDSESTAALLRVIRIEQKRGLAAAAIDHWLDLVRDGIPDKVDPSLLIHMALLLREQDHRAQAVRALSCALERSEDRENHVIAARIARAARGLDPGVTESAAWRALSSLDLSLEDRQALESLIAEVLALANRQGRSFAPPALRARAEREAEVRARSEEVQAPETTGGRRRPIEIETRARVLDTVSAVPVELGADGLEIQTSQGQKKLVRYERIQAVAVAAVHGLGPKPVLVVDLVLNWGGTVDETLRVIRMRGDQFDPRRVVSSQESAVDALRALIQGILERSRAMPLPDEESALGRPFASFEELAIYQRAVLLVEGGPGQKSPPR